MQCNSFFEINSGLDTPPPLIKNLLLVLVAFRISIAYELLVTMIISNLFHVDHKYIKCSTL